MRRPPPVRDAALAAALAAHRQRRHEPAEHEQRHARPAASAERPDAVASPASRHEHRRISLSPSPPLTPSPPRTAHRSPPPYHTPPPVPVIGAADLRGGRRGTGADEPTKAGRGEGVLDALPRPQMEDSSCCEDFFPTRTAPPFGTSVVGRPPRTPGGTPERCRRATRRPKWRRRGGRSASREERR